MEVQLYVYDLSQGLARQMSRQFLGVQIDAVYHTSLVFGGVEYFFGRGVQTCFPGSTHHGRPMEVMPLGQTALPIDIILEYLESLKEVYPPESYDLFAHNCNNFTNDFAMFLVGHGIPGHITSLPKTVLDTPFGQMLRPQIENAMRPVTQAPSPQRLPAVNGSSLPSATPSSNGISSGMPRKANVEVYNVTTETRLNQLLDQSKASCAVIFFTSASCAPCKMLYPIYDELAAEAGNKAVLIKVDVSNAREIGFKYSIQATPTFTTFLRGKREETWSGADASKLRGTVRILVQTAFPPHPHELLKLPKFSRQGTKSITYTKVPPLEKLQAKMGQTSSQPAVTQSLNFIKSRSNDAKAQQSTTIPDLPLISSFLTSSLASIPKDSLFTIYDLFRLLLIDPRISGYFAQESALKTALALLTHVTTLQASPTPCPYNLRLCAIHAACNLFTTPLLKSALRTSTDLTPVLVALIAAALLDESHAALRVSASSLAFNLATAEHMERRAALEQGRPVDSASTFLLSEAHQVELAASLLEALAASSAGDASSDAEVEAAKLQVLALGRLVYFAPRDGEVLDLCRALDARSTVLGRAERGKRGDVGVNGVRQDAGVDELRALMLEIGTELLEDS